MQTPSDMLPYRKDLILDLLYDTMLHQTDHKDLNYLTGRKHTSATKLTEHLYKCDAAAAFSQR